MVEVVVVAAVEEVVVDNRPYHLEQVHIGVVLVATCWVDVAVVLLLLVVVPCSKDSFHREACHTHLPVVAFVVVVEVVEVAFHVVVVVACHTHLLLLLLVVVVAKHSEREHFLYSDCDCTDSVVVAVDWDET